VSEQLQLIVLDALRTAWPNTDLTQVMARTVVAGGFVRDAVGGYKLEGDIDFFVHRDAIPALPGVYGVKWKSDPNNASAYLSINKTPRQLQMVAVGRDPIEFIKERFDFVACCGAVEIGTGRYWFHENFERDVKAKALTINTNLVTSTKSLMRAFKFAKRGWSVDSATLAQLLSSTVLATPVLRDMLVDERNLTEQVLLAIDPKGTVVPPATATVAQAPLQNGTIPPAIGNTVRFYRHATNTFTNTAEVVPTETLNVPTAVREYVEPREAVVERVRARIAEVRQRPEPQINWNELFTTMTVPLQ
jgi:hypothetical protein